MADLYDLLAKINKQNTLKAPDRNPLISNQAEMAKKVKAFLNKYETKKVGKIDSPWNKYGAGHELGSLLFGESPELLDDMSYGLNPLTSGGRTGRLPIPDKRLLDMPIPTPVEGMLGVIKNKGENWLTGSVENALKYLRQTEGPENPIEYMMRNHPDIANPILDRPDNFRNIINTPEYKSYVNSLPINQWIDGPLTNYIKNSMATPEDPIRLRADRLAKAAEDRLYAAKDKAFKKYPEGGVRLENDIRRAQERYDDEMSAALHYDPSSYTFNTGLLNKKRGNENFNPDGMASSELAKMWENASDSAIQPDTAGNYSRNWLSNQTPENIEKGYVKESPNLWVKNLPSDLTKVYELSGNSVTGFDHLVDEIGNALSPTSDLPNNLRLTPEDLANPRRNSMESMVDMVAKINQHRRRMAIEAEKKGNEAIRDYPDWNVVKEYPDGYRMVRLPDVADSEEAFKIGKACGEKGGWCTQGDNMIQNYGSGESRLNLLLDPDGKPVAQIETTKEYVDPINHVYHNLMDHDRRVEIDGYMGLDDRGAVDMDPWYAAIKDSPEYQNYLQESPKFNIGQIKGKHNGKPKAEHIPYLQDFVKSGNFSDVSDLDNVEMYRKNSLTPDEQLLADTDYLTMEQIQQLREGKPWTPIDTTEDW
jgi:hypothetical protein